MHGWSAPLRGWAADSDPLGTGLGLRELGFKLRWEKTRLILPPKELRGRQLESCEFLSLSIPRNGGPGTSTAGPPPEPLSALPAGRPHTRLGVSRHPAPDRSRAWSHRAGSGLGAAEMGVDGVARPKLSPVGGLGPAAARKTGFRRQF